ncbi:transposable element Tcb2 transposase [Trichonephila clavipes]|nr:transposable element Tcb2 transposase [Trichonephila clavipes]
MWSMAAQRLTQITLPSASLDQLRKLNHAGLYVRRPKVCIPLPSAHKRARLNWSLKHQHWSVGKWVNVMFSDESRFSLSSDSRRSSISLTRGSVIAQRYRDEVLEPYVRLFRGAVNPDFIFRDDNAPCHREVLMDDFLETGNIQRMSWPANSLDLNPIEHVWDMLRRLISASSHPSCSVTELKRALQEAWNCLSLQLIHHLIASMLNRCAVYLAIRGDRTPY